MPTRSPRQRQTIILNLVLVCLLVAGLMGGLQPSRAASPDQETQPQATVIFRGVSSAVKFDISPPLREIPPAAEPTAPDLTRRDPPSGLEGPLGPQDADPLVQTRVGSGEIPSPIISFDAFDNQLSYTPPDPVGDVGPNHYVAMANVHFAIFSKSGALLYGPAPNNTLWAGFGGACQNENSGDPIVVYDQLADRWMLTQFTSSGPTYYNCVALSTSGDPTGSYYRWAFSTGSNFPDYPKYGVWSDAYYNSSREFAGGSSFAGIGVYAYNRAQMLAGNPAPQVISFLATPGAAPYNLGDGLLPTDLDGFTPPPPGTPNFFVGTMDNGGPYGAPQDAVTLWKFTVNWANPASSSFVLANTLPVAPFDSMFPCSPGSRNCIPQPGTTQKVDILSYRQRPMWRLAYRNFGAYEALVANQSVEATPNMAGIRWYEIRDPNGAPFIYQQGTYAPGASDGVHRWMGSIAMDSAGNMALGYSASDGVSTYPSSWYTGRLASDPLGSMPQGEGVIINGSGSQLSTGSRWGDYTSMNVDPVDDCTFWYINEYYPVTSSTEWYMRIGAFKFPTCGSFKVEPASLETVLLQGQTASLNLDLINGTSSPVNFTILENPGVAWLNETPDSGAVAGGGVQPIEVAFDASPVGVGVYHTALDVTNDSAAGTLSIPITMTVALMGVDVSPAATSQSGNPGEILLYNLTLTNTSTIAESFAISLSGHTWTTTAPSSLGPIPAGGSAALNVSVEIPADALAGASDVVTATATSQLDSAASASAVLTSHANTVHGVELLPPVAALSGDPGEVVTYTLSLTNRGNISDTFDIALSGNAWATSSPGSLGPLAAGASQNFSVGVEIPPDAPGSAVDTTTVAAASRAQPGAADSSLLETSANILIGVQATPASQAKTGAIGSSISYQFTLTNTGNLTDTFNLSLTGAAWTTTFPAQATLGAHASRLMTATVDIPPLAANGASDDATLTFASQANPGVKAQVEIETTGVIPVEISLEKSVSAASAVTGEQLEYTLTVINSSASVNATGVVLSDTLPAQVSFVSANNSACNLTGNQVVCNLGVLLARHSAVVKISVIANLPGETVNQAEVSAFNDITPQDNFASATTEVFNQIRLFLPLINR